MNRRLKSIVELGLRGIGLASAARAIRWRNFLVLAYHNVVPNGQLAAGDLSLHLPQREFVRQLDWLRRTHDVVPLSALTEARSGRGRPRAAITFDDAYRGAVTVAADELAQRQMHATIFVSPAFIGAKGFWWDMLAPGGSGTLTTDIRQYCLDELGGRNDLILRWAAKQRLPVRSVPWHQTVATEAELKTCETNGNIALASHSWSHANLSRLTGSELQLELERPLAWLTSRFRDVIPWLAYPYGLTSTNAVDAVRASGYSGAFMVHGGAVLPQHLGSRPYTLPRTNVPAGLSFHGFALRASGIH